MLQQIMKGNRGKLAQAITLVESSHPTKRQLGQSIVRSVLEQFHRNYPVTFRIGITGPPGAGKSTFIETIGTFLTSTGHKVAVLAVDPTSSKSGGSLLGDRTRMPRLTCDPNAYIRPSPSSGAQGFVWNYIVKLLCADNYDRLNNKVTDIDGQTKTKFLLLARFKFEGLNKIAEISHCIPLAVIDLLSEFIYITDKR
jgi:LAO/AO transport system kinase